MRTPAAGFFASSAPWGSPVSAGSSNATQWTKGFLVGASGSSTTSSNCAVPVGPPDQVKAGDRSLPPARREAWAIGIAPSCSKSGLVNPSVSAPARFGVFQARCACPARRFFSNVPRTAIGSSLP